MRAIQRFLLAGAILLGALPALAGDLNLEASLIWAPNEPPAGRYTAADPDLAAKLRMKFRWDHYVEITNQIKSIPLNESRDFRMSAPCVLRIKNLGDSRIEVSCIGKGKVATSGAKTLQAGQWLVLGGDAKNNTAWFIGLRAVDRGLADAGR